VPLITSPALAYGRHRVSLVFIEPIAVGRSSEPIESVAILGDAGSSLS
jgi:hypothetical protein